MDISFENTPLVKFIQSRDEPLYQDLLKLKKNTERWLSYVPTTFAHYPSHGADHSEEIVRKMSAILFKNNDVEQPAAKDFNEIEAAILVAAAYTHDVGMVVSDDAKETLIRSNEWKDYIENNEDVRNTWKKALDITNNKQDDLNDHERLYIASTLQRWLITEYFRRGHALRSGEFLRFNQSVFGTDCLKDRKFRDAVAKVAEGHGISYRELENNHTYPEDTSIGLLPVNLRFLAIIMRFGDLLDMRSERSDTTYRNLTGIPEESVPHWDQYEDFRDEVITTEKIGFSAYCPTQESYRVLRTWCNWIEQESREASIVMKRAIRHADWTPPRVKVAPAEGRETLEDTIFIRPSPNANYVPHDWKFYFNKDLIIQRLAQDVYDSNDSAFIRELIQNSLDATRARLISFVGEYAKEKITSTYEAKKAHLEFFPITITLEDISTEEGHTQAITVSDNGTGMSEDIIKRYFLQIGQSYYTSSEFRSKYSFTPTSHFGIGFLSVFGVSDKIEVSTLRYNTQDHAIKITLSSPNDYLLTERCQDQTTAGTTIKVYLRTAYDPEEVFDFLQRLTEGSEIPIHFVYNNELREVQKHSLSNLKVPISSSITEHFSLKVFDIQSSEGYGQVGLWYYRDGVSEKLNFEHQRFSNYISAAGKILDNKIFYHGIQTDRLSIGEREYSDVPSRVTFWFNKTSNEVTLGASRYRYTSSIPSPVLEKIVEAIEQDFEDNNLDDDEKFYVIDQLSQYIPDSYIHSQKLIKAQLDNQKTALSIKDLTDKKFTVSNPVYELDDKSHDEIEHIKKPTFDNNIEISTEHFDKFLGYKYIESLDFFSCTRFEDTYYTEVSISENDNKYLSVDSASTIVFLDIKNCPTLSPDIVYSELSVSYKNYKIFNTLHPYGLWLRNLQDLEEIPESQIKFINSELASGLLYFGNLHIEKFKDLETKGLIPKSHPLPHLDRPWEGHDVN